MSLLDKKKELLTTLRAGFGIAIAIILTLTAGLIKMYYQSNIDLLFYMGIIFDIILLVSLPIIMKFIVKNIKELEEL